MAELQRLSSKQQILLNLYQVSDEQPREKEWPRHKHQPRERVAAEGLHEKGEEMETINLPWLK